MELITKYKEGKLTTGDINWLNYSIICLMVLIASFSIVWSVALNILSSDFHNGLFGAKLEFHKRNFQQLTAKSQDIYQKDVNLVLMEINSSAVAFAETEGLSNAISKEILELDVSNKAKNKSTETQRRKIAHLFQITTNEKDNVPEPETEEPEDSNSSVTEKTKIDKDQDRVFLSTMVVEMFRSPLDHSPSVQFIYTFPYLSEIFAIIWTAMCLIFQSGVKKYWGLPQPWRIVAPSILVFFVMSVATTVYTFLANSYMKQFCNDLKMNLTNPDAISCGLAISVLRPIIKYHEFSHDMYLNLFRCSYLITLILWILALVIMLVRFIFAIDFHLVDVSTTFKDHAERRNYDDKYTEILLNSSQLKQNSAEMNKSEEDFHTAKSHISETAEPLLESDPNEVV